MKDGLKGCLIAFAAIIVIGLIFGLISMNLLKGKKEASTTTTESTTSEAQSDDEATTSDNSVASSSSDSAVSSTDPKSEEDLLKFNDAYKAWYIRGTKNFVDKYANVKYPDLTSNKWSFQDFDDKDDGAVICLSQVNYNGADQSIVAVFKYNYDSGDATGYYLYIGGTVLYNDHTFDNEIDNGWALPLQ